MAAIELKPETIYTYTGYVRCIKSKTWAPEVMEIVCQIGETVPPVMLEAKDDIKKYLEELNATPFREAQMLMMFYFNRFCELRAIDVLDENGDAVKHIAPGVEWQPFIGADAAIGPWAGSEEEAP